MLLTQKRLLFVNTNLTTLVLLVDNGSLKTFDIFLTLGLRKYGNAVILFAMNNFYLPHSNENVRGIVSKAFLIVSYSMGSILSKICEFQTKRLAARERRRRGRGNSHSIDFRCMMQNLKTRLGLMATLARVAKCLLGRTRRALFRNSRNSVLKILSKVVFPETFPSESFQF